jgi:uncharacterized protein (TIGR03437 family)
LRKATWIVCAAVCGATALSGQLLSNASLTGKYFVRHVQYTTDAGNNATDARSITGTMTFDGAGNYTFSGQQVILTGPAAAYSVSGTYTVAGSGVVTLTNPQKPALTLNARFGPEAVIGSSTEASDDTFDIFAAIPAPPTGAKYSNSTLTVSWALVDFELTGASTAQVRDAGITVQFDGLGNMPTVSTTGHGASIGAGASQKQKFTGTYSVNADGSGAISFVPPAGLLTSNALLAPGSRVLGVSASGHMLLAGSASGHDILVGVRVAATDNITAASFAGRYWVAGLETDIGASNDYSGSIEVIAADSAAIVSERQHENVNPTHFNQTASGNFGAGTTSSGTVLLSIGSSYIIPGAGSTLLGADVGVDGGGNPSGQNQFAITVGEQIPTVSGSGVFVNPQGVVNAAGNEPVGNPISPGEFIAIYGTGLAAQTAVASPPYPTTLGGVSVSIGGVPAPLYLVSAGQINCLVPYELNTSSTSATIAVNNNGILSNTVTEPLSLTSPGIFSNDLTGTGEGAITHLNGVLVSSKSPAMAGETLVVYLTGLGALQNPIKDGDAPSPPAADSAVASVVVAVDGMLSANVGYAGINPVYPGLYQINFTMPQVPDHGDVQVAIVTPDAIHAQVSLFAQ